MKKVLVFLAIVVAVIAVISLFLSLTHKVPIGSIGEKKVAVVRIEGVILDSRKTIEDIKRYSEDPSVSAIVLRVNSPGGGVAPSQEIYDEVIKAKEEKKVVVSMGALAASGGYYIASPADVIIANPGTITGSIGVIMELPNIQGLMEKIGIETQVVKSGRLKDMASTFRSLTAEEREILQGLLDDVHRQFINAVAESRGMDFDHLKTLADGRIFSGEKARELGLVDELGNLEHAIKVAGRLSGIKGDPEVVTEKERFGFWDLLLDSGSPGDFFRNRFQTISMKYLLSF